MAPLWILFSHYMITCKAFWRVIDTLSHIMWLLSQKSKCYNAWFSKIDSFYRVLTGKNLKISVIGYSHAFGILCSTICDSKRWKRYNILPYHGQKIAKSASKVPFWHGDAASAVRYHDVSSRCTKNWIMAPLWILFSHYMITCKAFCRGIDTLSHSMCLLSRKSKCLNAWFSKMLLISQGFDWPEFENNCYWLFLCIWNFMQHYLWLKKMKKI